MAFICHNCGEEWEEDPRLSVPCPVPHCKARAGAPCKRPSGHTQRSEFGGQPHIEREVIAIAASNLGMCGRPKRLAADAPAVPQPDLFNRA